jgi:hypothetical protein
MSEQEKEILEEEMAEETAAPSEENQTEEKTADKKASKKASKSDKKLEEVGISSFYDLQTAYFLIKVKGLNQPKSIRDLVEEKYTTVIDLILPN